MVHLRDYQHEARDAILAAWGEAPWWKDGDVYRTVLANLTTSAGKTVIAGSVIDAVRSRGRCLFIADTDELCRQPQKSLYNNFKISASVEKADSRASRLSDVVIGSAQTLARANRLERFDPLHFSYIFVDEAHRGSDRNDRIIKHFGRAKVCGMTATAFRAKMKDLSAFYEHVAFEMGLFDLIGAGYITPVKALTLPVNVDISKVKQSGGDYDANELEERIEPYYEAIADILLTHPDVKHRQIIAFLPLIKASERFVAICREKGINARHVDGSSTNREQLQVGFQQRRFQLLSNSNLLTTGWDCPTCDCLLNLTPTRSAGMFRQKTGRIVRLVDGAIGNLPTAEERKAAIVASAKPDALILDLLWQTERFGLIGPADLIAGNENERLAIQMKIARLDAAENLEQIAADVQTEREAQLKKELEAAAKRQQQFQQFDTIELIGALLHSKKVMDFEPVMGWEELPPTEKQKEWLSKNGINPASAKSRGQVSALMNLMFARRQRGLCSHRVVVALERRGIANALNMTERQAYDVLNGDFPFPFGKHARAGRTFEQVPASMWAWCASPEQSWIRKQYPMVWLRLQKLGYVEKGHHQAPVTTDKGWWRTKPPAPTTTRMFDKLD